MSILAERLAGQPQEGRAAAELVLALARAVHYAHERQVIHRDLKPANVLLDADGTPRVTDFGLAKRLDESGLTQTGELLGTPCYIAPELTRGQGPGAEGGVAADVYGLGAILYEVLTGRPPFRGATALETLDQVRTRDPVPPGQLRAGLSRELQIISLKCLEKDPGKRYPSALALADDLSRWLGGRPILARPAGWTGRLVKWARRRPAAAALVGVSALALAGLVAGAVVYERRLQHALEQTRQQKERARENYREARTALHQMLGRAGARKWSGLPRVNEMLREQQEDALAFFLKVADQEEQTPEVRYDAAEACRNAARLQEELGRRDPAKENAERALTLAAGLADEFPEEPRYRALKASCLADLGGLQADAAKGLRYQKQALALREELAREEPTEENRAALTVSHNFLGSASIPTDKALAEKHFLRAAEIRGELAREHPQRREHREALAQLYVNLSVLYQNSGRDSETNRYHDLAERALEQLASEDVRNVHNLLSLALLRVNWAYVLQARGQPEQALRNLGKSINGLIQARQLEPNLDLLRDHLLRCHGMRAVLLEGLHRFTDAVPDRRKVAELAKSRDDRAFNRLFLAMTYAQAGAHAEAVAEARGLTRPISHVGPTAQFQHLGQVYCVAARAAARDGKLALPDRSRISKSCADAAIAMLTMSRHTASRAGWRQVVKALREDADFDVIRRRPEFARLLGP
jgi:tetratricopeptide (TPR) repeat protein